MIVISPEAWISYGLPLFGIAFGLGGLAALWIAARRFDARYGTRDSLPVPPRSTKP